MNFVELLHSHIDSFYGSFLSFLEFDRCEA